MKNRFPFNIIPPSAGDKLLTGAHSAKLELIRFTNDDGESEAHCQFEISGSLNSQADARALLAALLGEFNRPASHGGEAHA